MKEKRNITIYDIAREAGVSASLVSRVISGNGSVSDKNRRIIKELIEKYNFTPNALARGLQKSKNKTIGFLLPHVGNEYFSSVYYEFEKRAGADGYMTVLCNGKSSPEVESQILKTLEAARVEAIVIMGGRADLMELDEVYIEEIKTLNKSIPCVICSTRAFEKFGCIGIHADDKVGIDKLVQHIKEEGHQSFGVLGGTDASWPSYRKKQYFREAAADYGLEIREEWLIGNSFSVLDGAQSMEELLKCSELPDVICCMNDHVAVGAINAILDAGLHVPDDIAVTGYDGVEASLISRPKVTTICPNYSFFGETVYEAVKALLNGKEFSELTLIEPEIVIRESSRRQ